MFLECEPGPAGNSSEDDEIMDVKSVAGAHRKIAHLQSVIEQQAIQIAELDARVQALEGEAGGTLDGQSQWKAPPQ